MRCLAMTVIGPANQFHTVAIVREATAGARSGGDTTLLRRGLGTGELLAEGPAAPGYGCRLWARFSEANFSVSFE